MKIELRVQGCIDLGFMVSHIIYISVFSSEKEDDIREVRQLSIQFIKMGLWK